MEGFLAAVYSFNSLHISFKRFTRRIKLDVLCKLLIFSFAVLQLSGCGKDDRYNTLHPDQGAVVVTTDWSDRSSDAVLPDRYVLRIGDMEQEVSGEMNVFNALFYPGRQDLQVFHWAEGITIDENTATVNTLTDGTLDPMPRGSVLGKRTADNIEKGKYKKITVDKESGTTLEKTHTLAVGDFFMKDGSLLDGTAELTLKEKSACVVFWLGDATRKDKTLKNDHPGCTHGLVVALEDAASNLAWQSYPSSSVQDWLNDNRPGEYLVFMNNIDNNSTDSLNNIQGYNNTKAIEEFNNFTNGSFVKTVSEVVAYRTKVPAPANCSDWYLPSVKEVTLLCGEDVDNLATAGNGQKMYKLLNNGSFSKLGSKLSQVDYWSSTEQSTGMVYCWGPSYTTMAAKLNKTTWRNMRCVLAF